MERLRELRGPDTRERDLANILGFEHSRAVRWKEGQMYVDRAEYLVRLADALDVETMLLVAMASGTLTVEQAHRQIAGVGRTEDGKKKRGAARAEPLEVATDASLFALDGAKIRNSRTGSRAAGGETAKGGWSSAKRWDAMRTSAAWLPPAYRSASAWRSATAPSWCSSTSGAANVHAFEACRVLSSLTSRAQRRCRVVAGTATVTDAVEKPALMAGAANVTLFPFTPALFESELDRLEERLGPRKAARK